MWTPMTTEYQERFVPPCHQAVVASTSAQEDSNHPLKATSSDPLTSTSSYVTHKRIKKPPPPSVPPTRQQTRSSGGPGAVENQTGSKTEDYTSEYQNAFRAWKANKRQPVRMRSCLKVNRGLVVPDGASGGGPPAPAAASQTHEPPAFESTTSYRSDFVSHVRRRRSTDAAKVRR